MKPKLRLFLSGILFSTLSLASAPFTDNGDGTVKDNATGLIWQKCTYGKTYANGICTGLATAVYWSTAITNCNTLSLAGKTWRLPNRNELLSIVDYTRTDVAIDISVFDLTPYIFNGNYYDYWSSSKYKYGSYSDNTYGWTINFSWGGTNRANDYNNGPYNFRCVAGP
jgi:hypothetical protein